MVRRRPAAVTTMGVLNIVFGILFLLLPTCGGLSMFCLFSMPPVNVGGNSPPVNWYKHQWDFLSREVPLYPALTISDLIISFALAVTVLTSGIGLLNMQGWARITAIVYGVLNTLKQIGLLVFELAFVAPARQRWVVDFTTHFPNHNVTRNSPVASPEFSTIITVIFYLLTMLFGLALLIVMLLPNVGAAFSDRPAFDDHPDDDH